MCNSPGVSHCMSYYSHCLCYLNCSFPRKPLPDCNVPSVILSCGLQSDLLVRPVSCTPTFYFWFCILLCLDPLLLDSTSPNDFWFWITLLFCWTDFWFWLSACDPDYELDYLCWNRLLETKWLSVFGQSLRYWSVCIALICGRKNGFCLTSSKENKSTFIFIWVFVLGPSYASPDKISHWIYVVRLVLSFLHSCCHFSMVTRAPVLFCALPVVQGLHPGFPVLFSHSCFRQDAQLLSSPTEGPLIASWAEISHSHSVKSGFFYFFIPSQCSRTLLLSITCDDYFVSITMFGT